MAEEYSRELLRRAVAQICQLLGWHAMQSSPLAVLTHALEKYLVALAGSAHRYAEHDRRTEPNLDDLACAFRDINVRLPELRAYTRAVPPAPLPHPTPPYPAPKESSLNFLKPGSREVVTRPSHIPDYLPPMWPERETEPDSRVEGVDSSDPAARSAPADPFKRPGEPASVSIKKLKPKHPDDECHARELSSVMMTVSGFLSPAREGKLPEARTPVIVPDVPPEKIKAHGPNPPSAKAPNVPFDDRLDKKLKKKALNGKIEKSKKKDKQKSVLDPPFLLNDSRPTKSAISHHAPKPRPPIRERQVDPPAYGPTASYPEIDIKNIKKEPVDRPKTFVAPVENKIPKIQTASTAMQIVPQRSSFNKYPVPPEVRPEPIYEMPPNVTIKEEKVDSEKLTSQPDRSKLNIFKKISTKIKEEKNYESPAEPIPNRNVTIKVEKTTPPGTPYYEMEDSFIPPVPDMRPANTPTSAVDLSSKRENLNVTNLKLDPFEPNRPIKKEPVDDYPKDLSRPKISVTPHSVLAAPIIKEKKERKRKERKVKAEKIPKDYGKLTKKHPFLDKVRNNMEIEEFSGPPNIPPVFPFLSMTPGLIPNRNIVPSDLLSPQNLMPGGNLFTNLSKNIALRNMLPTNPDPSNLLPNPFSFKEGFHNFLPINTDFLPSSPGLISRPLVNPSHSTDHGFGQPPRMPQPPNLPPFLRRPSLEVIPIDGDDEPKINNIPQFVSPSLVIEEKEKPKSKYSVNNSFISNSVSITSIARQSPPKPNPIINIPPVRPDITIKLNTPPPNKPNMIESVPSEISEPTSFIVKDREKDKSEKKKDKLHKKERKDKEQRIKKKKDKKEKLKIKIEKKREKLEKQEMKERLKKEKKEKKREKERQSPATSEGLIPKLTLKLGSSSPMPPSPDTTKRLNIKPVIKKEDEIQSPVYSSAPIEKMQTETNQSPELAKISALVTRPPKSKSNKHNYVPKSDPNVDSNSTSSPTHQSNVSPIRKVKPPSSMKYKRIHFKPVPKRNSSDFEDPVIDLASEDMEISEPPLPDRVPNIPLGTPFYIDSQGNKVWVCPACSRPDNGTPMIACDGCDGWYHWVCVGIQVEPANSEDWYCTGCRVKQTAMASAMATGQTAKKRGRKPKIDKLKENR